MLLFLESGFQWHFDVSGLAIAARNGHLSVVKLLLNLDCDPDIESWFRSNIVADAVYSGHFEVVQFSLETHPRIERTGAASSALAMAAEQGHASIVNLLLAQRKVPTAAMT